MAEARRLIPISADWVLKRIQQGKNVKLKNAQINGDIDLSELVLPIIPSTRVMIVSSMIDINYSEFKGDVNFIDCFFNANVHFRSVTFDMDAWFSNVTFRRDANFLSTTFNKNALFNHATFDRDAWFNGATVRWYTRFNNVNFSRGAWFDGANFSRGAWFDGANFSGMVFFQGATIEGDVLTFRDATFALAKSQEDACRKAKNVLAKAGDREEEEYHFYREMEAKRKQNGIYDTSNSPSKTYPTLKAENLAVVWRLLWYDFIEHVLIQKMFGYGVHPKRLMISWGAIVIFFGFVYWDGKGIIGTTDWLDYIKVSFATAIAPGYIAAIINPGSGGYRLVPAYQFAAMIETIIGTFLWAGFIATFVKKYMR
jgi:hypothetical protein